MKNNLGRMPEDTAKVNLLFKIFDEYKTINYDTAILYSTLAYELSLKLKSKKHEAWSLYRMAVVHFYLKNLELTTKYIDRGMNLANDENYPLIQIKFNILQSALFRETGNYIKALQSLKENYIKAVELKIAFEQANALNQIGLIFTRIGEYDSAIYYHLNSNGIFTSIRDSSGIYATLYNIGNLYLKLGEFQKAKQASLDVKKILEEKGPPYFKGQNYNLLGVAYLKLNDLDSAMFYLDLAYHIAENVGNKVLMGDVILNMAGVNENKQEYDKALESYKQAFDLYKQANSNEQAMIARFNMALIYERRGQYQQALDLYDTCLQIAIQYKLRNRIAEIYYNIFKTYKLAGNYKVAFEYQSKYLQVRDSIFNLEKAEKISELELKYEKEKNQAEILKLENETLEQKLKIKKRTNERNLITLAGFSLIIVVVLILFYLRQKMSKDRLIKEKEIERLEEEKKIMAARSIVEGQEDERRRIATELHDGIGVLLSSIKLQFTSIEEKVSQEKETFRTATAALEQVAGDVRRISHNMMPGNLVKFGLFAALEDLIEKINNLPGISAEIQVDVLDERLPENHEIMIYRVVQELVNNTLKHAQATNISLWIRQLEDGLQMNYADNGKGFNPEKSYTSTSLGMKSIRSRIEYLGGELNIDSVPGKGSSFFIRIPML